MERTTLFVDYDATLVSPAFMAEHILELEGVSGVDCEAD